MKRKILYLALIIGVFCSPRAFALGNCTVAESQGLFYALKSVHTDIAKYKETCADGNNALIKIEGKISVTFPIKLFASSGITLRGVNNGTLVRPYGASGAAITLTSDHNIVEHLIVETTASDGIEVTGNNNTIRYSTLNIDHGQGVTLGGTGNSVTNTTITAGGGISIANNGNTVTDNTISAADYFGIAYASAAITCVHQDNTFKTMGGPAYNACTAPPKADSEDDKGDGSKDDADKKKEKKKDDDKTDDTPAETGCYGNQLLFGAVLCCDPDTQYPSYKDKKCITKIKKLPGQQVIDPTGLVISAVPQPDANTQQGSGGCSLVPR